MPSTGYIISMETRNNNTNEATRGNEMTEQKFEIHTFGRVVNEPTDTTNRAPEKVRNSEFGCRNCLFACVECTKGSMYAHSEDSVKCTSYAYCD